MRHIDTLKTFEDLVASGVPESQAKTQARLLDSAFDNAVTSEQLNFGLTNLKHELQIFFTWELGIVLLSALIIPIITKRFGWSN